MGETGRYHLFSQPQFTSFMLGAKVINPRKWFSAKSSWKLHRATQLSTGDSLAPTSSFASCNPASRQEKTEWHSLGARSAGCCASGPPCYGWWCRSPSRQRSCCSNSGSAPRSGSDYFWTLPPTWPQNTFIVLIRTTKYRPMDMLCLKLKLHIAASSTHLDMLGQVLDRSKYVAANQASHCWKSLPFIHSMASFAAGIKSKLF